MIALLCLFAAVCSAFGFPRAKGNARMSLLVLMLVSLSLFLWMVVNSAHPGL